GRPRPRGSRVQRCARIGAWPRAAHRGRADERRVERRLLARVTWTRADARAHRARLRRGESVRSSLDRCRAGAARERLTAPPAGAASDQPDIDRETDENDDDPKTVRAAELVLRDRVRERRRGEEYEADERQHESVKRANEIVREEEQDEQHDPRREEREQDEDAAHERQSATIEAMTHTIRPAMLLPG